MSTIVSREQLVKINERHFITIRPLADVTTRNRYMIYHDGAIIPYSPEMEDDTYAYWIITRSSLPVKGAFRLSMMNVKQMLVDWQVVKDGTQWDIINVYGILRLKLPQSKQNRYNVGSRQTPIDIKFLNKDEVLVFSTNLSGQHGVRPVKFGAKVGKVSGIQGQTYPIPIKTKQSSMLLSIGNIKPYVDDFIKYAKAHPKITFLVTNVGCDWLEFAIPTIVPLFEPCVSIQNIWLPKSFWDYLLKEK